SWVRLLYLYPSSLTDELIDTILRTEVAYFDLSLQHVSAPLLRRMRRFGNGKRFLERIDRIRKLEPGAALRSSFILGYPGETEEDHDDLIRFLQEAELDWAGFFSFSQEEGTYAASLEGKVDPSLALDRLVECAEIQDGITARRRSSLVGSELEVLVESAGVGRTFREAPEIDGVVRVQEDLATGSFVSVLCTDSIGPDLLGEQVVAPAASRAPAGAAS
ncbi:MAG: radical SAM protein, partial [Acidimicrobiales bacterium]